MQNKDSKKNNNKIGVVMLNLGTPDATNYWSVRKYLSEFLGDRRVIDYPRWFWQPLLQLIILTSRPFRSGRAYKSIWNHKKNESPLKTYTRSITKKLQAKFDKKQVIVEWGMRYGNPSTQKSIESLINQGCDRILFFAMYPQYSATTTATAYDKAFDVLKKLTMQPAIRTSQSYYNDPKYIEIMANLVVTNLKKTTLNPDVMLVSFHGLPKRYITQGDDYEYFCTETSRLICKKLGWDNDKWITTFQSRFGPEEWLQPYTDKTIEKLAKDGVKNIAVISPAFACDCLETLEELAIENKDIFIKNGGNKFTYIPCLNDTKPHIEFLESKIRNELSGWIE